MPTIIFELGVNWNGDLGLAQDLICAARDAGAKLVKFQFYSARDMFGPNGSSPNPELAEEMSWIDLVTIIEARNLKKMCNAQGLEFFASAFDTTRLGWLEEIGVKRHKIASRSVKYAPEYCLDVLALSKPTYVSLGMWGQNYIPFHHLNACYLYCISTYPTLLGQLDLPEEFPGQSSSISCRYAYMGFSDHTIGLGASLIALSRGAQVIERHMTTDKSLPGPDHAASSTPDEMADLVKYARAIEEVLQAKDV